MKKYLTVLLLASLIWASGSVSSLSEEIPKASSSLFTPGGGPALSGDDYGELVKKGDLLFTEGRFNEALIFYKKALASGKKESGVLVRIGDIRLRAGMYEEAGKAFEKALKINPGDLYAMTGLADIRMEEDRLDEAEALLKKALGKNPRLAVALTTMGDIYLDRGQLEKSAGFFQKSLSVMPDQPFPDTYIGLGELALKRKSYNEALTHFEKARSRDFFDADGYIGAFKALRALGRKDEAAGMLELCLKRIPLHREAGIMLTEFYLGTGGKDRALELYRQLMKKYPKDEDLIFLKNRF